MLVFKSKALLAALALHSVSASGLRAATVDIIDSSAIVAENDVHRKLMDMSMGEHDHHMFKPLTCNSNLASADCTTTKFSELVTAAGASEVKIDCGTCAYVDYVEGETIDLAGGLNIEGKLLFGPSAKVVLRTPHVFVQGELEVNNPVSHISPVAHLPHDAQVKFVMYGTTDVDFFPHPENIEACEGDALNPVACNMSKKPFVTAGGTLKINAIDPACPSWTKLLDMDIDNGKITVDPAAAACWGDESELLITSSSHSTNHHQKVTIMSSDATTGVIEIDEALTTASTMALEPDYAVEVALLNRNFVLEAEDDDTAEPDIGGHFIILHTPIVEQHIQGMEIRKFGQAGRMGKYPLHFHMCSDVGGTVVSKNVIRHSNQRGVVIHGTHNVTVSDNVAYDIFGHGYMLEDGCEISNTFRGNLGAHMKVLTKSGTFLDTEKDFDASVFWITNAFNVFDGNVAAGAVIGFWFDMKTVVRGSSSAFHPTLNPQYSVIDKFVNNTAHSNNKGISFYKEFWTPAEIVTMENTRSYRNRYTNVFLHGNRNIRFVGGLFADSEENIMNFRANGITFEDITVIGKSPLYTFPHNDPIYGMTITTQQEWAVEGIHLDGVHFERFGQDVGCPFGSAAITMDDTSYELPFYSKLYTMPTKFQRLTFDDGSQRLRFRQAITWSLQHIAMEDVDGSLSHTGQPGFFVLPETIEPSLASNCSPDQPELASQVTNLALATRNEKNVKASPQAYAISHPSKVVDGNIDRRWFDATTSLYISKTMTDPYLTVDLFSSESVVKNVTILPRKDAENYVHVHDVIVDILDQDKNLVATKAYVGTPSREESVVLTFDDVTARYVTVRLEGPNRILSLAEVQVYGTSPIPPQSSGLYFCPNTCMHTISVQTNMAEGQGDGVNMVVTSGGRTAKSKFWAYSEIKRSNTDHHHDTFAMALTENDADIHFEDVNGDIIWPDFVIMTREEEPTCSSTPPQVTFQKPEPTDARCHELIKNGDFEDGTYYPFQQQVTNLKIINAGDGSNYLKVTPKSGYPSWQPYVSQYIDSSCFVEGAHYHVSASYRLKNSAGNPIVCDPAGEDCPKVEIVHKHVEAIGSTTTPYQTGEAWNTLSGVWHISADVLQKDKVMVRVKNWGNIIEINNFSITKVDAPSSSPTPMPSSSPSEPLFTSVSIIDSGKSAVLSTTYPENAEAYRAIDGDTSRSYGDGSVAVSEHKSDGVQQWWRVDFYNPDTIIRDVTLYSRSTINELTNFDIIVEDFNGVEVASIYHGNEEFASKTFTFDSVQGRYLKVKRRQADVDISLAEVEVMGEFGSENLTNIAKGKPVSFTNTSPISPDRSADLAVSGDTTGLFNKNKCACSNKINNPRLEVDLGNLSYIEHVVLFNRVDNNEHVLTNFKVEVLGGNDEVVWTQSNDVSAGRIIDIHIAGGVYGKKVAVQKLFNDYLVVCEFEIYGKVYPPLKNLVSGKSTVMSSTYVFNGGAYLAIDGNTSRLSSQGSVAVSSNIPAGSQQWWRIDFYDPTTVIRDVTLYSRSDKNHLINFDLIIEDFDGVEIASIYHGNDVFASKTFSFPFVKGRYLKVKKRDVDAVLSIAEVEVMGFNESPPLTNIARNKAISMSAVHTSGTKAVNGDTSGLGQYGRCAQTFPTNPFSWMELDLVDLSYIEHIVLFNRVDGRNVVENFDVEVKDDSGAIVWSKHQADPAGRITEFHIDGGVIGSKVKVSLSKAEWFRICEFEIYGAVISGSS